MHISFSHFTNINNSNTTTSRLKNEFINKEEDEIDKNYAYLNNNIKAIKENEEFQAYIIKNQQLEQENQKLISKNGKLLEKNESLEKSLEKYRYI